MTERHITFSSSPPSYQSSSTRTSSVASTRPRQSSKHADVASVGADEIKAAFSFFDVSKRGAVGVDELRSRLSVFYPELTSSEYGFLLLGKDELTEADLQELLTDCHIPNYDHVAEAFKLYDPAGAGYVDTEALRGMLVRFGLTELTKADMAQLIDSTDSDKDGKISLGDFRKMLQHASKH